MALIQQRQWRERVQTAPTLPGPREGWIALLESILVALLEAPTGAKSVSLSGNDEFALSDVSRLLGPALTERRDGRLRPTAEAELWLSSKDPIELAHLLHARVRLMGELLSMLRAGPLSHEELRVQSNDLFKMNWATLDQLRRRTGWMRLAGLVEVFDGTVRITALGRNFLDPLTLDGPDVSEPGKLESLASPQPATARALEKLRTSGHAQRSDASSLFLPAPDTGSLSVAREVVMLTMSPTNETALEAVLTGYGIVPASARQARGTLKTLGLIERVSESAWVATPGAQEWLSTGDGVDFVRLVHTKVRFIGEILALIPSGLKTSSELAQQSGTVDRNRLSAASVRARLQLLREAGVVEKLSQKEFSLTAVGRTLARELPMEISPLDGAGLVEPAVDEVIDHSEKAQRVCVELTEASRDSRNPDRFEYAVRDAFRFLGFTADRLGGPGRTDVRAQLALPDRVLVVAVDAKSSGEGVVPEAQVNLQALKEHRASAGASLSVLVGNEFHRRTHTAAENDGFVAIVRVSALMSAVSEHAVRGLSWDELAGLFDPTRSSPEREANWAGIASERDRLLEVLTSVLTQLGEEASIKDPMYEGAWLGIPELRRDLRQIGASQEEIETALGLLTSPQVAAVSVMSNRYRLSMHRDHVGRRLASFGIHLLGTDAIMPPSRAIAKDN
jgi:hypothetical protein